MESKDGNSNSKRQGISLDTWAVILAFALALLVRYGILKQVPW